MTKIIDGLLSKFAELVIPLANYLDLPVDKVGHVLGGFASSLPGLASQYAWAPLVIAAAVGALKELYDFMHPDAHMADPYDFAATTLGGLPTTLLAYALS